MFFVLRNSVGHSQSTSHLRIVAHHRHLQCAESRSHLTGHELITIEIKATLAEMYYDYNMLTERMTMNHTLVLVLGKVIKEIKWSATI